MKDQVRLRGKRIQAFHYWKTSWQLVSAVACIQYMYFYYEKYLQNKNNSHIEVTLFLLLFFLYKLFSLVSGGDDHLLLESRSDVLQRLNRLEPALEDAIQTTQLRPFWSKVSYLYFSNDFLLTTRFDMVLRNVAKSLNRMSFYYNTRKVKLVLMATFWVSISKNGHLCFYFKPVR